MKRRQFLGLTALLTTPLSAFAITRNPTPSQAEGPFYPVVPIPLSNNLIHDEKQMDGVTLELSGQVLDQKGKPLSNVKIEIWQCDAKGLYTHPRQPNTEQFDPHFRGFGAMLTNAQGSYHFRTIMPVPYTGRPPHIHVKLWQGNRELLTTQLYLKGQTGFSLFSRDALQINPKRSGDHMTAHYEFVV